MVNYSNVIINIIQLVYSHTKSLNIVCNPLARALNSTPISVADSGYFHSIVLPNDEEALVMHLQIWKLEPGKVLSTI